jgi:hypothetical protein
MKEAATYNNDTKMWYGWYCKNCKIEFAVEELIEYMNNIAPAEKEIENENMPSLQSQMQL